MTNRNIPSSITTNHQDEDVIQGLVTAGALLALADGRVQAVERDELMNFVQQLMPATSNEEIGELFDHRTRELEDREAVAVITEKLRPLAGLSLASVVVRTAERVAAADRQIHPNESQAIRLIRLFMASLPAKK
jgi:tellurite resistance protein TerB